MKIKLFHIKPAQALVSLKPKLILFFVTLIFLSITLILYFFIKNSENASLAEIFRADAKQQVSIIENRINYQLERLGSLDNFFKNSEQVSKKEFRDYVNGWGENNGYTIFGWAELITKDDLVSLTTPASDSTISVRHFHDVNYKNIRSPESPVYILSYIDPLPNYSHLIDLNILSIPEIFEATNNTNKLSETIVTSRFNLGSKEKREDVVAILKPQVREPTNNSQSSQIKGYLIGLINLKELLHHSQPEWITTSLIVKLVDISSKNVLYSYLPSNLEFHNSRNLLDHYQHIFQIGNRLWQISIYPTVNYYDLRDFSLTWATIPIGLTVTLLVFLYLRSIFLKQQLADLQVKKKTKELIKSEERIRRLVENAKALIFRLSLTDRIFEYISPAVKSITGYHQDEFFKDPKFIFKIIHPDSKAYLDEMWTQLLKGDMPDYYEFKIVAKNGDTKWVRQQNYLECENGKPIAVEGVLTDVTEQKYLEDNKLDLERKIFKRQKLESIGELVGGIAHDYNNLLFAVIGNIDLALNQIAKDSAIFKILTKACDSAQHAANITKQLIAYAGKGKYISKDIDLSELVEQSFDLISASIPNSISLKLNLHKDIPRIQADREQAQQILINLIINAAEAFNNHSGNILITTGYGYFTSDYLKSPYQEETPKPGHYCFIEVKDNGCGMDENTKNHLFEPFFTTKFFGRGLGMAASLGIVKSHNGTIKIETQLNQGTAIRVLFPVDISGSENN